MSEATTLDRVLVLELVRVTEAGAIAASALIGRGDEKAADQAAVDAIRTRLNDLDISGIIVIGEGERDEAPMLYIGEEVGKGGPDIDIALDPLEGTTITAKAMPNALAVVAFGEGGTMLRAPDVYMDKIAVGGGYEQGIVDLDKTPAENLAAVAAAKGVPVSELTACVLDRPRHAELIAAIREADASIQLIGDGDIAGVMAATNPEETGVDIYFGSGGAPEGVLAAAALRCIGGQIQGRLLFRNDDERGRARKWGIEDLNRKYDTEDMVSGDVIFAATGVTDGSMLSGVRLTEDGYTTETLVMRSGSKTVRTIATEHHTGR
jgi:fructose-1,6-bisphosphatase II / sedoheptulose-1,7-bisphosphatase